ncbi:MAG: endonuclease III [Firmicutes bacterium]|nr:endonuclease III [Bacillota bacterium]
MRDVEALLDKLDTCYPDAHCELDYGSDWQLLVAVILSAQCTDKRVNQVTPKLFERASSPQDFVDIPLEELEKLIYSCGFYHNKAKNIKLAARDVVEKFGGAVPGTIDELVTLAGVGRKTANVVFAVGFKGQAMPVDTHVFRLAHRLGLSDGKTPEAVEKDLRAVIPEKYYTRAHHLLIFHGRYTCKSRRPECDKCMVKEYCVNPDFHS